MKQVKVKQAKVFKEKRLQLRAIESFYRRVNAAAHKQGIDVSKYIRQAVEEKLQQDKIL